MYVFNDNLVELWGHRIPQDTPSDNLVILNEKNEDLHQKEVLARNQDRVEKRKSRSCAALQFMDEIFEQD